MLSSESREFGMRHPCAMPSLREHSRGDVSRAERERETVLWSGVTEVDAVKALHGASELR
jgi:hypothetical protein